MYGTGTDLTGECCKIGMLPCTPLTQLERWSPFHITGQYFKMSPTSWAAVWAVREYGPHLTEQLHILAPLCGSTSRTGAAFKGV